MKTHEFYAWTCIPININDMNISNLSAERKIRQNRDIMRSKIYVGCGIETGGWKICVFTQECNNEKNLRKF